MPAPGMQVSGGGASAGDMAAALRPTGKYEGYPRAFGGASANLTAILTSGTLFLTAIYLPAGFTVTNVEFSSGTTAAVTPTNWWFALYSSALALLSQTADQTTTAWGANTRKVVALGSAQAITTSGLYYCGVMVAAATTPTLKGHSGYATINADVPIINGTSTASLTTTAPGTAAAITATADIPYVAVS